MGRKTKGDLIKMKILVAFYSRTGSTKNIAENIAKKLNADIEEIIDLRNRKGILGWLLAGRDAFRKRSTTLRKLQKNPSDYDVVILGTPLWAGRMAPAIRTYLSISKIKKAAFFITCAGSPVDKTFQEMGELLKGAKVLVALAIKTSEPAEVSEEKINRFVEKIK
jgi:flavodoxin